MTNPIRTLRAARARHAVRRDLMRLDARALEDIGLNRADIDIRFG